MDDNISVAYIAGASRSGSTLLAMLLGALPGCVSVGELRHVWERGLTLNQRCGCGQPFWDCPFWNEVGLTAFDGWDKAPRWRMTELQQRLDRFRQLPKLASMPIASAVRREVDEYTATVGQLYRAVAHVSGSRVVVDSSKAPSFAAMLPHVPGVSGTVFHLVRDSRAVAHSWSRRRPMPEVVGGTQYMAMHGPVRSAVDWTRSNLAVEAVRLAGIPVTRLRYEAIIRSPAAELTASISRLGIAAHELEALAEPRIAMGAQHTVAGNPARFATGELRLRPDEEWRRTMPAQRRRTVEAITWPLLAGYGYPIRG